jgi:putative Holliday junction resolvase
VRVLGVDFGLRNLGLALSDPGEALATPLRSLRISTVRDAPAAVALVVREVEAGAVVVGAPEGLEGEEGRAELRRVKRFATALRRETGLPVHLVDESLSSREAGAGSGPARDRDRASAEHAAAAAVILQRWLDRPRKDGGSR